MTDQINTVTMTEAEMLAYESGRRAGIREARATPEAEAPAVRVKALVWTGQEGKSYRQSNCELGQYQVSWLGEFECWQLSVPHMQGKQWKDNFSRHSSRDNAKAAAQADYTARILSALEPAPVQCCMCGKVGISTVEGDGGPECQLPDGRWTCSRECWDRATEPAPVQGWQDIATAPKDGTEFLATSVRWFGDCDIMGWHFGGWRTKADPDAYSFKPTHWQPLPAPPAPQDSTA